MSLVLVRSSAAAVSSFFRTPLGRAVLLFLLEAALIRVRRIRHPSAKVVAGVIQTLAALGTVDSMRAWLTRELPKLNGELARLAAKHNELNAIIEVVINAVNRPA
jgi:hypothetical protein